MYPELELCCGTIRQASLPELIEAAAATGFAAITANPTLHREAGLSAAELRARLRDAGVRVSNIDGFGSGLPGIPAGAAIAPYRSFHGRDVSRTFTTPEDDFYRSAEELGAESVNLVHFGGDPATPRDAIAEAVAGICARAAGHGLRIVLEFIPDTGIPDIGAAADLVARVGAPNLGIMFDTRHLTRSGGSTPDVARHAGAIQAIQLSDLRIASADDPNRLLPGEGELPLVEMLTLMLRARPTTPVGVEVFNEALPKMTARDAARAAADSLRPIVDQAVAALNPG